MTVKADKSGAEMRGTARVVRPNRSQLRWDLVDPEGWLPAEHQARDVWAWVETLDLTDLYAKVKARGSEPGRPCADPAVLLALWMFATGEGVGSARLLDRLVERDLAYRWLAGDVPINYHQLADFRVAHGDVLDKLLTASVTVFVAEGLMTLDDLIADGLIVDGTKVKAWAGGGSFKRAVKLQEAEAAAQEVVAKLKAEVTADPAASSRRRTGARARAARERVERIAKAREVLSKIERERAERAKKSPKEMAEKANKEPQASTTDAAARRMRFADGAVRAGFNVQVAATCRHGIVTQVQAADRRNDTSFARPMLEASERRLGCRMKCLLADKGYAVAADVGALGAREDSPVTVYIPPPADKENIKPDSLKKREKKRAEEPEVLKAWRQRMAGEEGKAAMKKRSRIERINAHMKNRGLGTLLVRGLAKVQAVVLLHALTHNLVTLLRLKAVKAAAIQTTAAA